MPWLVHFPGFKPALCFRTFIGVRFRMDRQPVACARRKRCCKRIGWEYLRQFSAVVDHCIVAGAGKHKVNRGLCFSACMFKRVADAERAEQIEAYRRTQVIDLNV